MLSWIVTLLYTARATGIGVWRFIADMLPYVAITAVAMMVAMAAGLLSESSWALVVLQPLAGMVVYVGINFVLRSRIQADAFQYLFGRIFFKLKFGKTANK